MIGLQKPWLVLGIVGLAAACSGDNPGPGVDAGSDTGADASADLGAELGADLRRDAPADAGAPEAAPALCACAADEACDPSGACVPFAPGPDDHEAELILNRQVILGPTSDGPVGTADFLVWSAQPFPADTRPSFTTDENERCTSESNAHYPYSWNGKTWPLGPYASVGNLTITAAGAPGPIVLEPDTAPPDGTFYWWTDEPPPLVAEGTVLPFFAGDYLPIGGAISLQLAGGPAAPAQQLAPPLEVPETPTFLEPDVEHGAEVAIGGSLRVRWAPTARAGTEIELAFAMQSMAGKQLVSCLLEDDGEVVLPGDKLAFLTAGGTETGIYISRRVRRTLLAKGAGGTSLFIRTTVRNDRVRQIVYTAAP
jgi:hypothetical protein